MKRICSLYIIFFLFFSQAIFAQKAQILSVTPLNIPPGDYSGIVRIEDTDSYAVVSDKADGFFVVRIPITETAKTGKITRSRLLNGSMFEDEVTLTAAKWTIETKERIEMLKQQLKSKKAYADTLKLDSILVPPHKHLFNQWTSVRDCEGIAFIPSTKTFFISGESDQLILEYDSIGTFTGRSLQIPPIFSRPNIHPNYGFEALCYSASSDCFYTTTENQLPADGPAVGVASAQGARLRIQSFDAKNLSPKICYAYLTDEPSATSQARQYAFGVPELCALPSGDLLVLEREFWVGGGLSVVGSYVQNKLYKVSLSNATDVSGFTSLRDLNKTSFLPKDLVLSWKTTLSKGDIANYEGMCLGPTLNDGRQTLLLVNDSQHAYKGVLGEYLMIIALSKNIK